MFRDDFRSALRTEVEAIPLPPPTIWARGGRQRSTSNAGLVIGAAATALLVATVMPTVLSRASDTDLRQLIADRVGGVLASPPARPTILPDGRRISPLPNIYRNEPYAYNLVVPAWFQRSTIAVGAEGTAGLLYREVYSAREVDRGLELPAVTARTVFPSDLIVEVWQRGERDAAAWAPVFGCDRSPDRAALCDLTTTRINGTPAVVANLLSPVQSRIYLVERGGHLIVLRYGVDGLPDADEEILDKIVRSLGLP